MRQDRIQAGDTLQSIAIRNYYVYDDQSKLDQDRIRSVANELIKSNTKILQFPSTDRPDALQARWLKPSAPSGAPPTFVEGSAPSELISSTIILPDITGIPPWGAIKPRVRWRNWVYVLLLIIGIAAGTAFSLAKEYLAIGQVDGQQPDVWIWLSAVLQRFITAPGARVNDALPWLIAWSLIIGGIWLYRSPSMAPPYRRTRLRYLLAWCTGLVLLTPLSYTLINTVLPGAAPELLRYTSLVPLVTIWSTLIFLVYLYRGDGSEMHTDYLQRYNGVWAVFALVVLLTFLAGYSGYLGVRARVEGDLSIQTLMHSTAKRLQQSASDTLDDASDLGTNVRSRNREDLLEYVSSKLPDLKRDASSTHAHALAALRQINAAISQPTPGPLKPSLQQIKEVITEVVTSTSELMPAVTHIDTETMELRDNQLVSVNELETTIKRQLVVPAEDANDKATIVTASIEGIKLPGLALFLWFGFFYAVFVLFPWMLLMLFLFQRRNSRTTQILEDIELLDPDPQHGLLKRALGLSIGATPLMGKKERRLMQSVNALSTPSSDQSDSSTSGVTEALANQAFSNFEYILSLFFLSLLTAVGWYYVFYPQTSLGVAGLIEQGSGVKQLSEYLVTRLTPMTLGFAGAYFFLMQMLVRRYLAGDLYPAAFLQAAQRLLLIFILSLALSVLAPVESRSYITAEGGVANITNARSLSLGEAAIALLITLVAFLAGIFPTWGLRLISTRVSRRMHADVPEVAELAPLTYLDGLTVWTEARLLEENVENIQSLATAPIEQLVLRTHFPTTQLVDWIDQALLYLHSGNRGEWFFQFRNVGIRTASDLLDSVEFRPAHADQRNTAAYTPPEGRLRQIVAAVTAARDSGLPTLPEDNPRVIGRKTAVRFLETADTAASIAADTHTLVETIRANAAHTYDYVALLQRQAQAASQATQDLMAEVTNLIPVHTSPPGDAAQQTGVKSVADATVAAVQQAAALADKVVQAAQPLALQPLKLDNLDSVKQQTTEWQAALLAVDAPLQQLTQLLTELAEADATRTSAEPLLAQARQARAALDRAREATAHARERAQSLDAAQPEMLDARQLLKARLNRLGVLSRNLAEQQQSLAKVAGDISQFDVQQPALTPRLESAGKAVKELEQPLAQASTTVENLATNDPGLKDLPKSRGAIEDVYEVFQNARNAIQTAVFAVGAATAPPQLTSDILRQICSAMWPDPNVQYVLNYYQNYGKGKVSQHTGSQAP